MFQFPRFQTAKHHWRNTRVGYKPLFWETNSRSSPETSQPRSQGLTLGTRLESSINGSDVIPVCYNSWHGMVGFVTITIPLFSYKLPPVSVKPNPYKMKTITKAKRSNENGLLTDVTDVETHAVQQFEPPTQHGAIDEEAEMKSLRKSLLSFHWRAFHLVQTIFIKIISK